MARKLTNKQAIFVAHTSKGVSRTQAARLAGFSAPAVEAYRLMRLPHVVDALKQRRDAALKGDLAALAVDTMRDLMAPNTPAATRYNAARWVLENAGHSRSDNELSRDGPMLQEMDAEELAQAVASGMQALRELAEQLGDHHVIDGQVRALETVELKTPYEVAQGDDDQGGSKLPDFLQ